MISRKALNLRSFQDEAVPRFDRFLAGRAPYWLKAA